MAEIKEENKCKNEHSRVQEFLRYYQWIIIGLLAVLAVVLGCIGFKKYFIAMGQPRPLSNIFYLALQLFVLESGSIPGSVAWELEVARFLAPAISAYAAVTALALIFRENLKLLRVRLFMKDHIIICGLGRKGLLLAERFCVHGYRVVAIEQDEDNDFIQQCKHHGVTVLIGNAADRTMLRIANISKAKYLISVCGDDGVNAEVALHARKLVGNLKGKVLTCIIHIYHPQLCHLLREEEIRAGKTKSFRLEFFNVFENAARAWLIDYPAFNESSNVQQTPPHLLIIGLGKLGKSLIIQAARNWRALNKKPFAKIRVTLIDRDAKSKIDAMHFQYPQLNATCEFKPLDMDINSPAFNKASFLFDNDGKFSITNIYVCLDNDSFGLSTALALHQHLRDYSIPIHVRMVMNHGLASLLQEDNEASSFSQIHAFGYLDHTCKPESILAGTHELLARTIHEDYVQKQLQEGKSIKENPSMVPWDQLPESLKESNRCQADHIGLKLKAIGCAIAPLDDWDAKLFKFTPGEIELMAEMEHERFCSERKGSGWKYAPGTKSIENKTSPYLIPWDELNEDMKELDRNTVRDIPFFLAKANFQIYRLKKSLKNASGHR